MAALAAIAAACSGNPADTQAPPTQTVPQIEPERILSIHSDIVVHADGSLTVTDSIKVRCAAREIKHGIIRYLTTRYEDWSGHSHHVSFGVREVLRDGKPEAHHIKELFNGIRLYIGNSNVLLKPGEYTYTITYDIGGQIDFHGDSDVLYWNVTGNGWAFPTDEASATVVLPPAIPRDRIKLKGLTGPRGSRAKDWTASLDDSGNPAFSTTKPLKPREGLAIVVTWPKGFIAEPTPVVKPKREEGP